MLRNKNTRKFDSKIRFQNRSFRRQLDQARSYRRSPVTDTSREPSMLSLLGLGTIKARLIFFALVSLVIYLAWVPNFLSVKNITITGLDDSKTLNARSVLAQYFTKEQLWPQNNLLMLSTKQLSAFLLKNDSDILNIKSISKQFPNKLTITLEQRRQKYLLQAPEGSFILSNDGLLQQYTGIAASSSLPEVKIISDGIVSDGGHYSNQEQLAAFDLLENNLPGIINSPINYLEVQDDKQPDIDAYTQTGTKYLFDDKENLSEVLNKLHILLTSIDPKDEANLAYVDMRINNRGYVCLLNTPCAAPKPIVAGDSTTTATSTLPQLQQ